MFSTDEDDESFNVSRKTMRTSRSLEKRKSSYKNKSDEENSIKPRKVSINNKRALKGTDSFSNGLISHPGVCGTKFGIGHSTPLADINFSPPKDRRSLISSNKTDLQDDTLVNDDVEEMRVERENQSLGHESTFNIDKASKSLEIFANCLAIDLSTEQLATHLTNCIELNAANKINVSNAFSLKLIDYMVVLLKRNDKTMKDFPTMSCSLDAGTRIYACRVDNVHAGIMEIVNGLAGATEKRKKKLKDADASDGGKSDDDDVDDENANCRSKNKKRKAVLASTSKAITRNNIEKASWMTRKAIEPNFTALFNEARMVQGPISCLSLLKSEVPLIPEKKSSKASQDYPSVEVKFPEISRDLPLFGSSFSFEWDEEKGAAENDIPAEITTEPHYGEPTCPDFLDIPSDCDVSCEQDDDDNNEEKFNPIDINMDSVSSENVQQNCISKPVKKEKVVDMLSMTKSNMVFSLEKNDYSYLNSSTVPMMWAGPEHWKPVLKRGKPTVTAECAERKIKKLKKKAPDGIDYSDFSMMDIYLKKYNSSAQLKAMKKWSENKVSYPVKKDFKIENLYRSFNRKTLFSKPFLKPEKEGDECNAATEYADNMDDVFEESHLGKDGLMALQDLDDFDADRGSVQDNHSDNGDFGDDLEPELVNMEDDSEIPQTGKPTLKDDLVPLPRMVECGTINYATVPKTINMKKLKETVWSLMKIEENKENDSNNAEHNVDKSAKFSEIYSLLPDLMPSDTRNDLSPALAFLSVLHLANEKTLLLASLDEELSDFSIKKEM